MSKAVFRLSMIPRQLLFALTFMFVCDVTKAQTDSLGQTLTDQDSLLSIASIPLYSSSGADIEEDLDAQDASAFLQASKDVFMQVATFQLSAYRYRMRGYEAKYRQVFFNGFNMANPETGIAQFSLWSGLSDATRFSENGQGLGAARDGYSGISGYTAIQSQADVFKKQFRCAYARSNRQFANRLQMTYAGGLKKSGWAFCVSTCLREADAVYVAGTFMRAAAAYASLAKHFSDKHRLAISTFVSATQESRAAATTKEAYALAGNNFYNPTWGFQNGKVRSARVNTQMIPVTFLTYHFKPNSNFSFQQSLAYAKGFRSASGLNYNNANNPQADYYRYLPSYALHKGDSAGAAAIQDAWTNDVNSRQLNWDRLIAMNRQNIFVLPGEWGNGPVYDERRARYILENKMEDSRTLSASSICHLKMNRLFVSTGVQVQNYYCKKYKVLADLLGADFWLDYDQFAPNQGVDASVQQNDLANPDRKVKVGDAFGYAYNCYIQSADAWLQGEYSFKKTETYLAGQWQQKHLWREGLLANGKFPNNSKGKSEELWQQNRALKAGLVYKITGRNALLINAAIADRAPEFNQLFISPANRNDMIKDPGNEQLYSADLSYQAKFPALKLRCSGYFTQIKNQSLLRTYWHEAYNALVNLLMNHIDKHYSGVEFGLEKTLRVSHVCQLAIGVGKYVYSNRPMLYAWQDNNASPLFENRAAYLKNYRIGGMPQLVMGFNYRYQAKKNWYVGLQLNEVAGNYLDPNPDRRTKEALDKYLSNEEPVYQQIVAQEKLAPYACMGLSAGKSFRLKHKQNLSMAISVANIPFQKNTVLGGYEPLRWDSNNISTFANKYSYLPLQSYLITLNYAR